ncbi:MAG: dihydrodipicolinate synthase family protein [Atribacterota bacterium]
MAFWGVIVPLITPLNPDETVDVGSLRECVRWVLQAGVHGILAGGSMGEYPSLEEKEKEKVFETICGEAAGRAVVLLNISDTGEKRVLENLRRVRDLSADAYVLTPPYYFVYNSLELESFFFRVADSTKKPLFVYNIPEFVGNALSGDDVLALSRHPNIVGLKDSSGNFAELTSLLLEKPDAFYVFQGYTEMSFPSLIMGCCGLISGLSNVVPEWFVKLFSLVREGKWTEAKVLQQTINRVNRVLVRHGFLPAVKYTLSLRRLCASQATSPFGEVSPEGKEEIAAVLQKYGVI